MAIDAQTFADWDVDYVKLDGCYSNVTEQDKGYPEFGRLLNITGRPMVYSCSWPVYQEETGIIVSNLKRIMKRNIIKIPFNCEFVAKLRGIERIL